MTPTVLVTGAAGFVGAHVSVALARAGLSVVGCDAASRDPRDARLERERVATLLAPSGIPCHEVDLGDGSQVRALFAAHRFTRVVHLAGEAGTSHPAGAPDDGVPSSRAGFAHLLAASRIARVDHLVYASTTSAGASSALAAHAYPQVFRLPCTGLRLFDVYGPWARPDGTCFELAQRIRRGEPVTVVGDGDLQRDLTYVDDAVEAVKRAALVGCANLERDVPHVVLDVGHHRPVRAIELVRLLERALGRRAVLRRVPARRSEAPATCADPTRLREWTGFAPETPLAEGLRRFVRWLEGWDPLAQVQPGRAPPESDPPTLAASA